VLLRGRLVRFLLPFFSLLVYYFFDFCTDEMYVESEERERERERARERERERVKWYVLSVVYAVSSPSIKKKSI